LTPASQTVLAFPATARKLAGLGLLRLLAGCAMRRTGACSSGASTAFADMADTADPLVWPLSARSQRFELASTGTAAENCTTSKSAHSDYRYEPAHKTSRLRQSSWLT
jgi:hypothetical protein